MQVLKDEVRETVAQAALAEFAMHGLKGSSMGAIARRAGISVGNVYRYFQDKEALFLSVVPQTLVDECRRLLQKRIRLAMGLLDPVHNAAYAQEAAASNAWMIRHRHALLILLRHAQGTHYETFFEETVGFLVSLGLEYAKSIGAPCSGVERQDALRLIYRAYLISLSSLLEAYADTDALMAVFEPYQTYHLSGLRGFFHG